MNLITINTDGLEESIRCILCKNHMATEFGCDGNCVVDDSILANICDEISSRITERYRWHDLRQYPNDLPESCYEICEVWLEGKIVDIAIWRNGAFVPWYSAYFEDCPPEWKKPVVAWKYIEPFEVTE